MKAADTSPKDGAQRQREFKERQRARGYKEFRAWATDEEARQMKKYLAFMRRTPDYYFPGPIPPRDSRD